MTHCLWSCCLLRAAWSLDCTAAAAPRGKGVCVCLCVPVGSVGGESQAGGQNWTPLSIRNCYPLPPTAPCTRNTAVSLGLSPPDSLPSSSTPGHAKRSTALARAVLPSLVEQNQFHLLSWEALSCRWLLHQTIALPLTPSQLLLSSGAGTLHVCCFVTAWWMLLMTASPEESVGISMQLICI